MAMLATVHASDKSLRNSLPSNTFTGTPGAVSGVQFAIHGNR
jgi:hypothetical protein